MRQGAALIILLLAAAGVRAQDEACRYANSYKGKASPEIANEKGTWLNAEKPLTLKKLEGEVVLLVFTTLF